MANPAEQLGELRHVQLNRPKFFVGETEMCFSDIAFCLLAQLSLCLATGTPKSSFICLLFIMFPDPFVLVFNFVPSAACTLVDLGGSLLVLKIFCCAMATQPPSGVGTDKEDLPNDKKWVHVNLNRTETVTPTPRHSFRWLWSRVSNIDGR